MVSIIDKCDRSGHPQIHYNLNDSVTILCLFLNESVMSHIS